MTKYIITTASWEDRFDLGMKRLIETENPESILLFYYEEYKNITRNNRIRLKANCDEMAMGFYDCELSFSAPAKSWKNLFTFLSSFEMGSNEVIIDISTMPREAIWSIINMAYAKKADIRYLYNCPESYNKEWLSQEPGKPRIVYKMGGIAKLSVPTKLFIITGYDVDRAIQIINHYEPESTFLGLQSGDQFENEKKNIQKYKEQFSKEPDVEMFEFDAYSDDRGYEIIDNQIRPYIDSHNILISSLGPKLSAIALFQLYLKYSEKGLGLVYAPSEAFNPEYSYGLGIPFEGKIEQSSH